MHKETKKVVLTKINRKPLPLGQEQTSGLAVPAMPLGFYSELTQVLPETWMVMRVIFGEVSHLLTAKEWTPQFQNRNKSSRSVTTAFGGCDFPPGSTSRRKRSCVPREAMGTLYSMWSLSTLSSSVPAL